MTAELLQDDAVPTRFPVALIVDDNAAMRGLLGRLLTREGYRVLQAADGIEALDVIRSAGTPVDIVIADVLMPEMSGDELARHLRAERPELPIVFVSGQEPEGDVQAILSGGSAAFLAKPFSREALELAVQSTRAASQPG